jgi:cyclopropane fatty-acyl-phospholipid synthase-like methyltransferase
VEPGWLAGKRQLGEAIERDLIAPWRKKNRRAPRILALGSGSAPVERVWHERGHAVTFHECQESSLVETRRACPTAEFLIGDIFQLAPEKKYDLVTLITIDYVMNRREFVEFLRRAACWLEPGGQIILYCASTLSFRQMAVEFIKRALGRYRNGRQIFWGYWRTPGEFFRTARAAQLRVSEVYHLGTVLQVPPPLIRRLPPWRSTHLVVTLE